MFGLFPSTPGVAPTEAFARLGKPGCLLLDVRTPSEVSEESIAGTLNIPLDEIEDKAGELNAYETIDVICHSGARSAHAVDILHAHGVPQAQSISGGLLAWAAAGLPTV